MNTTKFAGVMALGMVLSAGAGMAQDGTNACQVDGCVVEITATERVGDEIKVTMSANYTPNMAKNHLHIWWGENYDIRQVSGNAESLYEMEQGVWQPTDSYPEYTTGGVISVSKRGDATTLCVTSSGRTHDILDPDEMHCVSVADLVE